jgi:multidrug efflux pump subunit AcrA (membrane-fusion protein)
MNYKTIIIGTVTPLAIWILAGLVAWGIWVLPSPVTISEGELRDESLQRKLGPFVSVQAATRFESKMTVHADGVVVPFREIQLAAQVAGRIDHKSENCRAGRQVKQGDELFRIDQRDYLLTQQQLTSQQQQAEIDLEQVTLDIIKAGDLLKLATDDLDLQIKEYERLKNLRVRNAITDADVERGQRGVIAAQNVIVRNTADLDAARKREYRLKSDKELLNTQMEKANLDLERTIVTSPVDGVIVQELVETDSFAQRGTTLVVIEDTQRAEIRANLKMDDLMWVLDGESESLNGTLPSHPVTVTYEFSGKRPLTLTWQGRLDRFDGRGLDTSTRTVPIRIVVDEPDTGTLNGIGNLVRGMFVELTISVFTPDSMILIPKQSLTTSNQVFVVQTSDQASGESGNEISGIYSVVENVIPLRENNNDEGEFWIIDTNACDLDVGDWIVTQRMFGLPVNDSEKSKVRIRTTD